MIGVDAGLVEAYRRDGFVAVRGVFTVPEAARFRSAALDLADRQSGRVQGGTVFTQLVNAWQIDEAMAALTLDPRLGEIATSMSGMPMRLWHDHMLIKQPGTSTPTEFHQDQPYWPHEGCRHALSMWIALCDVPAERGCMTFIPRSHELGPLAPADFGSANSMFDIAPELAYGPRVTLPLRAGDLTVHNSCCAHGATANVTQDPRVAHIVLFMDAETRYRQRAHPVTDPLDLREGDVLDGEAFPLVAGVERR